MNPQQAVRSVLSQYTGFSGRARRSEYWYWQLVVGVIGIMLEIISAASNAPTIIGTLCSLATVVPSLAVLWRRLHDTGRSGWWFLITFTGVGIIVLIVFACFDSTPGVNQYGPIPPPPGYAW